MDFLRNLENELRPGIQKILTHPFLAHITTGSLTREQLRGFAIQYTAYCDLFPQCLAAVAANVPDDQTRFTLVDNLWEEHGSGNQDKSHRVLFRRFLEALGISDQQVSTATFLISTQEYVRKLFCVCRDGNFLEGLGALSVGTEFFTTEEYVIIVNGLRRYSLSDHALEFWTVHIGLDEDHYQGMHNALAPWSHDIGHQEFVRGGAQMAIELELSFWDGLQQALQAGKLRA